MTPLVSIPVLAYNHGAYIAQTLDGILMQKVNFPYEVIIGEDGSTDDTLTIVNSYAKNHSNIKVLTSKENIGFIKNSERILKQCRGEYLAFCEGDDYWHDPLKLKKQVEFLEIHPEYGMIHTDVDYYYQKDKHIINNFNKKHGVTFPSGITFDNFLTSDYFIKTATVVVRKELFLEASDFELFITRNWLLTDLPVWLYIIAKSKIKYFEESTAIYRLREESASRTNDLIKKKLFHESVYDIRYYYWHKFSRNKSIKLAIDRKFYKTRILDSLAIKDYQSAKLALTTILRLDPEHKTYYYIFYLLTRNSFILKFIHLIKSTIKLNNLPTN